MWGPRRVRIAPPSHNRNATRRARRRDSLGVSQVRDLPDVKDAAKWADARADRPAALEQLTAAAAAATASASAVTSAAAGPQQ